MTVFGDYSRYYNLLYKDKDYTAEVEFVRERLVGAGCRPQALLDLGCGTGRHALEMARQGLAVTGVDMSETMLDMGRDMLSVSNVMRKPSLLLGDARSVRLGQTFDAVTSLFHFMSYQTSEKDALAVLTTAREHLKPGGVFLFDFWYGPGVLTDPPTKRQRTMEDDRTLVVRRAIPLHKVNDNVVEVNYHVTLTDKDSGKQSQLCETHSMRYWFMPELRYFAHYSGFTVVGEGAWMQEDMPHERTWNAWMAVQRGQR